MWILFFKKYNGIARFIINYRNKLFTGIDIIEK